MLGVSATPKSVMRIRASGIVLLVPWRGRCTVHHGGEVLVCRSGTAASLGGKNRRSPSARVSAASLYSAVDREEGDVVDAKDHALGVCNSS